MLIHTVLATYREFGLKKKKKREGVGFRSCETSIMLIKPKGIISDLKQNTGARSTKFGR